MKLKSAIIAASFIGMASINAANIFWSAGINITGDSDISTNGTFVLGQNYGVASGAPTGDGGTAGDFTIGDVTFTQTTLNSDAAGTYGAQFNTGIYTGAGSSDFHAIMDSNMWGATGAAATVIVAGLTANTQYEIQVFMGDDRNPGRTATIANGDGSGTVTGVNGNATSYIGTFTTGAAETTVEFQATNTPNDSTINLSALQVRTVPEPSSTALLGLGGFALIMRRRK